MAWRDQLQEATFRGVPFFIERASTEYARRVVQHEYVTQDETETEDLGGKTPRFLLDGFVIGAGYFRARDLLEDALRMPGPGDLIHPYRGTLRVQLVSVRIEESTREGGLARFSMEFIRAAEISRPNQTTDSGTAVSNSAAAAAAAADGQFVTRYAVPTDSLLQSAATNVLNAFNQVEPLIGMAQILADEAQRIALSGQAFNARLKADIARITSLVSLRRLFGIGLQSNTGTLQARVNSEALAVRVQTQAIIRASELASTLAFPSYDEAIAVRDELAGQLDRVALTADDELFAAVTDLRTALVVNIGQNAGDLARITMFVPTETLPALVIAHTLYGAADLINRSEELILRNHIIHPGFVAGGVPLEVLSE